jgi:hypothetical protein
VRYIDDVGDERFEEARNLLVSWVWIVGSSVDFFVLCGQGAAWRVTRG